MGDWRPVGHWELGKVRMRGEKEIGLQMLTEASSNSVSSSFRLNSLSSGSRTHHLEADTKLITEVKG